MSKLPWCVLFICMVIGDAYKILVVFPIPSKSHGILGTAMVKHLLNFGHEVTYITPFPVKRPHPHMQQVNVTDNLNFMPKEYLNITTLMSKEVGPNSHEFTVLYSRLISTKTLENENVQKLMDDSEQKFDLIIVEWLFSELLTGLSPVFEAPYILAASTEPHWIITRLIDDALNPSYNSDVFSFNVPPFTFCQRVEELWTQMKISYHMYMNYDDLERQEYERLIVPIINKKGRKAPSFYDVKYNASLVLGNSYVSLGQATIVPNTYKFIGGYHVDEEVKPLPPNLQLLMDNAKEGVIFFSMGSQLNSTDLPADVKRNLLNVFGSLKQKVIWKLEEKLEDLPENVRVLKWAPQQSVLAHPNCVLFITHGGLLSITEAVHFGVPIIGIPGFGDQFVNIQRAISKGFASKVKLSLSMADDLKVAIDDMLNNKTYSETAKKLSSICKHRPVPPGSELAHWVEHVIMTGGAPHLRSHGTLVPWYQKLYLDLLIIIFGLLVVVITILKRLCRISSKVHDSKKRN